MSEHCTADDADRFESSEDEAQFHDDMQAWELCASEGSFERWYQLPTEGRRKLWRQARRLARRYHRQGYDAHDAAVRIIAEIGRDPEYGSIALILLLAALSATIQFWIRRWWENWVDRRRGGMGPTRGALAMLLCMLALSASASTQVPEPVPPDAVSIESLGVARANFDKLAAWMFKRLEGQREGVE